MNIGNKETLRTRGIRFSDSQWKRLQNIARNQSRRNVKITASDVVRHAVTEMEKKV